MPWVFSCKLLHIFRTPFPKDTSGGLLLYPVTSLKEKTPTELFSDEFARYLIHLFYRTSPDNCFCSTEKCFTNKIEIACKKNNDTRKTKTGSPFTSSLHILLLFKKFPYSQLPTIYWKHEFLETMQSHWGISTI